MCGVAGAIHASNAVAQVSAMVDMLRLRGPNASGVLDLGGAVLGHSRLSILDLDARSNQPMARGCLAIAYNGELWNFAELRAELEALGQRFSTTSDTEVLLGAWRQWGEKCLRRFHGMFAFAIHDGSTGETVLAKDRWGKCPLAWSSWYGGVVFASELKALRFGAGVPLPMIREVEPGTFVRISANGKVSVKEWFLLDVQPRERVSASTASAKVGDLLAEGVRARMIADVPVCCLLSGGIDSASIAFLAKKSMPNLVAFTAVWDEKSADLANARENAALLGVPLVEVSVPVRKTRRDLLQAMEEAVLFSEVRHKAQVEIAVACRALAREIAVRGFRVVFSGEGSDELWGTYRRVAMLAGDRSAWDAARREAVVGQWRKNFPRCNKVFLSHGVECRLPFLHPALVEYGLSLPPEVVQPKRRIKRVLVEALLRRGMPPAVAERKRVAFQTGLGIAGAIEEEFGNPTQTYNDMHRRIFSAGVVSRGVGSQLFDGGRRK